MNVKFEIQYAPHAGQQEVIAGIKGSEADVVVIVAARGWGKTLFTTGSLLLPTLLERPHSQAMWVAPTYKICKAPIDDVWNGIDELTGKRYIPQFDEKSGFKFWEYKAGDMELHLFNKSRIFFRSATNPDSIVAKGYNIIVIDEAALISKEVFMQQILPTARKLGCKIVIITTPRGKNWVYELFLSGQDKSKKEYISFKQPYSKRPDYPPLLLRLMKDMPQHLREQEFFAEFIADGSGTFKNLDAVFKGPSIEFESEQQEWRKPNTKERLDKEAFVIAVDFAKSADFTVITAFSQEKRDCVYYRRLNKVDYKVVLEIVRHIAHEHNFADVIFDATGVGGGLSDFLGRDLNVYPYVFTNQSKNDLVNRLILACEYAEIEFPNIQTMRQEFEIFTYELTRTGKMSYNAPDGKHDDTIISAALANWYITENAGKSEIHAVDNFLDVMNQVRRPRSVFEEMMDDDS